MVGAPALEFGLFWARPATCGSLPDKFTQPESDEQQAPEAVEAPRDGGERRAAARHHRGGGVRPRIAKAAAAPLA